MNKRKHLLRLIGFAMIMNVSLHTMATHNRAGEITYRIVATNTIEATIVTYTKTSGGSLQADRDSLTINWGDGNSELINRYNGIACGFKSSAHCGEDLTVDVKVNKYLGTHTYKGTPAPPNNFFIISMQDLNRTDQIININAGNSVSVPFYLEDTVWFPTNIQNIGYNNSPILLNPPIDYANVGDTFVHNPLAFDPDGDSLVFTEVTPLQDQGQPVPQFQYPRAVMPGANNKEYVDVNKGIYTWAVPQQVGIYNVAFLIKEYRRGLLLGTMIRDMQIFVEQHTNHPPDIAEFADTCVRAGDTLIKVIYAGDQDSVVNSEIFKAQKVTFRALGAPLLFDPTLSPATFDSIVGNPVHRTFTWNTICAHIRKQPYQVLFKATDDYSTDLQGFFPRPLSRLKTWQIEVIAPPPLNLQASAVKHKITLHWNPYKCSGFGDFRGFSVWRRVDSNAFVPDYCETGLAGRGYTMIANKIIDTAYVDSTATRGQDWCYRILAHFSKLSPNGLYEYDAVVSVPSNEACVYLPFDVPVITNASVTITDHTAGQIFVAWSKPRAGGRNLDTIQDAPPYRFDLYRSSGYTLVSPTLIHTVTRPSYTLLNDTTYTDVAINTTDTPYTYRVYLYAGTDTVGSTDPASSVYLSIASSDRLLHLSWQYKVPWTQDSFQIFRQLFKQGPYLYLTTRTTNQYTDTALTNDSTYCYYVRAYGHYSAPFIKRPVINDSETKCGIPKDTIAPCPPQLQLSNDCGSGADSIAPVNHLHWHNFTDSCASDALKYYIYYAPDTGVLHLIDSVTNINDTTYDHLLQSSLTGCYAVTAIDRVGNESLKTNRVCIEDCPLYVLPNTFTPNGDGHNDLFIPIRNRFITHVEFKIFNRWGDLIFETTDAAINWDGKDQNSHHDVAEGTYIYSGYYFESTLSGEVKKPLPSKNGGGFIQLIRSK